MLFWGGVMALDWVEVRELPVDDTRDKIIDWILLVGILLGSLILNWKLTAVDNPISRLVLAMVVGFLAFTVIGAPCSVLLVWFHLAIGGSL